MGTKASYDLLEQRIIELELENKQLQVRVKESESKYGCLFDQGREGLTLMRNRVFVDCNQTILDLLKLKDKKDFPGTFDPNNFIDVLGVSAQAFFATLKLQLEDNFGNDYKVLVRLNCEGVEDDVIYAARHQFGKNLKLVCGSIKDVRICKGEDCYKALLNFMQQNSIPYVSFSPGMSSWLSSFLAIKKITTSL